MLLGLPIALWLGHVRRGGFLTVNISNVGRAVPVFAVLLVLSLGPVGAGELGPYGRAGLATLIALVLFALPPLITNAYVGITEVDRDVVEAARGMGMSERKVFTSVELPLADAGRDDRRTPGPGAGVGDRHDRRPGRRPGTGPDHHPRVRQPEHTSRWWPARCWSPLGALLLELVAVLATRSLDPMRRAGRAPDEDPTFTRRDAVSADQLTRRCRWLGLLCACGCREVPIGHARAPARGTQKVVPPCELYARSAPAPPP